VAWYVEGDRHDHVLVEWDRIPDDKGAALWGTSGEQGDRRVPTPFIAGIDHEAQRLQAAYTE
jgi:hypothetical protein